MVKLAAVYWLHFPFQTDVKREGYVGVTAWTKGRKHIHLKRLRLGTHQNPKLQAAYNAHGRKMIFEVIKRAPMAECLVFEAELRPHPEIGLNLLSGGGMPPSKAGLNWFTNGIVNFIRTECPNGFWPGKIQSKAKPHASLGRSKSAQHRRNIARSRMGKTLTPETIAKIVSKITGLKRAPKTCPHCGTVGGGGAMVRFHFDRCRRAG